MTYITEIEKFIQKSNISDQVDNNIIEQLIKSLGPGIYNLGLQVSLTDKEELQRIKKNFIIGRLGLSNEEANHIINQIKDNLKKKKNIYAVIFYYKIIEEVISTKNKIPNIHPGEILNEEFLIPMSISAYKLSKDIGVPQTRISKIIQGKRSITADTALRLSKYFGNSSKFWLGLQNDFDLEETKRTKLLELIEIKKSA